MIDDKEWQKGLYGLLLPNVGKGRGVLVPPIKIK